MVAEFIASTLQIPKPATGQFYQLTDQLTLVSEPGT